MTRRPPKLAMIAKGLAGTKSAPRRCCTTSVVQEGFFMNSIIYLVGLVVIVLAILSFIGLA
jgi:hypothetical protein